VIIATILIIAGFGAGIHIMVWTVRCGVKECIEDDDTG
jgi:hypothetical protein